MDIVETVRIVLGENAGCEAIFDDRIYPEELPDAPTYPAIVITKATGQGSYDMQGDVGLEAGRVQVDVYAEGYAAMVDAKTAVRRCLSGFKGGPASAPCSIQSSFCINDTDLPDPDTVRAGPRLRRRMLEFQIWNTEV